MYCPYKPEELVAKEIEYFWPGVIAYGFPAYINGSTGLGKTNVFLKVMADATNGIFPPGVGKYALVQWLTENHQHPVRERRAVRLIKGGVKVTVENNKD